MNRRNRTLVVLIVAIAVASGASYFVYRAVTNIPVREVEVRSYYVAVAAKSLPVGTMIAQSDVKLVPWPAASPVAGGYSKVEEVVNRGLISSVVENEPLTSTKLAVIEAGAGLPPTIATGMRAISVKVNEVIGVAGFVVPGTRVDVMVTLSNRQQQQDSLTRVVVSNVQVLTAGTRIDQENAKDGKPIPSTVVTLLVAPEDGERIALAASEGQIMLTLRNPLDTAPTSTTGVRTGGLFGPTTETPAPAKPRAPRASAPAKPIQPEPAAVPAAKSYTVEAIRGAKRTQEIVR